MKEVDIKVGTIIPQKEKLVVEEKIKKKTKIKAIEKGGKAKVATKTKRTRKTKDEDIEK